MGTGSTRRRSIARSRYEQYRAGNYVPAATEPQHTTSEMDFANGLALDMKPRADRGGPLSVLNTPGMSPEDRLAAADAEQKRVIALGPIGVNPEPLVDPTGQGRHAVGRDEHGIIWSDVPGGTKKKHNLTLEEQFNALYGDPTAGIRDAYKQQEAAINAQYDSLLSRLGTEHGAAERGVRAEGQHLQTALAAIGADATAALTASNRQIDQDYAKALRGVNADYKPLAGDLKTQGAGGAGLKAEAAAGRADLREAHVTDAALGQRYQQMLGQEINNRQATGTTVTTANVQDLARILQQSRDTASTDRLAAVAKVEANMAGDLAQAQNAKRTARYSFFLSVLKSGGTLGQAGLKAATPGVINSAIKTLKTGKIDFSKSFEGLTKSKDPDEVKLGQEYEQALLNHTKTPQQVWAEWQANPDRAKYPLLSDSIMQLVGYAQALEVDPKTLNELLKQGGYRPIK